MKITHEKILDCTSITADACSDKCLEALGHSADFNLKSSSATDILHGSVSIIHNDDPLPHIFSIEVYEVDELPTAERQSTLKRPTVMPTQKGLKSKLDAM